MLMMTLCATMTFTACGSDEDDDTLTNTNNSDGSTSSSSSTQTSSMVGWWISEPTNYDSSDDTYTAEAYQFLSNGTAYYYKNITNSSDWFVGAKEISGLKGFYCGETPKQYSFYVKNNIVYINSYEEGRIVNGKFQSYGTIFTKIK